MILIRVQYAKIGVCQKDREYQLDGVGSVSTIEEWKKQFPAEEFDIYERCCGCLVRIDTKCPVCKESVD